MSELTTAEGRTHTLMTWVRFDDMYPMHRKIAPLDDATFRLHSEAVFWCSRNLTDGRISADELSTISTRATVRRVGKLTERGLWHVAGYQCPSEKCPKPGLDGWVIHDYLEYQPTKERVKADLAAKAERTRLWRERKAGRKGDARGDPSGDASRDASSDRASIPSPSPSPPRPEGRRGEAPRSDASRQPADGAAGIESKPPTSPPCPRCGNPMTSAYHRNVCREGRVA